VAFERDQVGGTLTVGGSDIALTATVDALPE
jgi:hypothetical protein